jgi:hypothetical protein
MLIGIKYLSLVSGEQEMKIRSLVKRQDLKHVSGIVKRRTVAGLRFTVLAIAETNRSSSKMRASAGGNP